MRRLLAVLVVLSAVGAVAAVLALRGFGSRTLSAPYPEPKPREPGQDGVRLQRTMRLLSESAPEARNEVRILFYGQSITRSAWTRDLTDRLRLRFPNANLVVENRAIGGFTADLLVKTAEHDVYAFWPDLIIMHDLYIRPEDFDVLINALTSRTTAEIAIQTTHRRGEGWRGKRWDDKMAVRFREVADAHNLELVDVRSDWNQYLDDNGLHPMALLLDEAGHLNGAGDALMSKLVERSLRVVEGAPVDAKGITDIAVGPDIVDASTGTLTLKFTGTRVEAVFDGAPLTPEPPLPKTGEGGPEPRVTVDGASPSNFAGAWAFTRPNGDDCADWPWEVAAPIRVTSKSTPVAEEWTITLRDFSADYTKFKFTVHGSVTGPDGEGSSDADFTSKSGRVVIASQDWWLAKAHAVKGRRFADGHTIKFRAIPLHSDMLSAGERVVVVSGLENKEHTLVIEGTPSTLKALRVFRPLARR